MGALGGFAAGLSDGINEGRNYNLRQDQVELEKKRNSWAEEDHNAKVKERKDADEHAAASKAIYSQYYGEKEVDQDDGQGNPIKVKVPGKRFGQDKFHDINYLSDVTAHNMLKKGADPKDLMAAADYVQKFKETEEGKQLIGALAGNADAQSNLLKSQGLDGSTAKWEIDPAKGVYRVSDGTGKTIDMNRIAMYLGADKAYKVMSEETTRARGNVQFGQQQEIIPLQKQVLEGNIAKGKADAAHTQADTDILIPAKAQNYKDAGKAALQSANAQTIRANNVGAGRSAAVGSKASKEISSYLSKSLDFKTDPHANNSQMLSESIYAASGGKKSPQQAAAEGAIKYQEIVTKLQAQGKNKQFLASKGVKNSDELIRKFFSEQGAPQGNSQVNQDDGEE